MFIWSTFLYLYVWFARGVSRWQQRCLDITLIENLYLVMGPLAGYAKRLLSFLAPRSIAHLCTHYVRVCAKNVCNLTSGLGSFWTFVKFFPTSISQQCQKSARWKDYAILGSYRLRSYFRQCTKRSFPILSGVWSGHWSVQDDTIVASLWD